MHLTRIHTQELGPCPRALIPCYTSESPELINNYVPSIYEVCINNANALYWRNSTVSGEPHRPAHLKAVSFFVILSTNKRRKSPTSLQPLPEVPGAERGTLFGCGLAPLLVFPPGKCAVHKAKTEKKRVQQRLVRNQLSSISRALKKRKTTARYDLQLTNELHG